MTTQQLSELTQSQRDRLAFIELRLRFVGEFRRQDLVSRFGIQTAAATRDLGAVQEFGPAQPRLRHQEQGVSYAASGSARRSPSRRSRADLVVARITATPSRYGYARRSPARTMVVSSKIDLDTLSVLTRAITASHAVEISYRALTSGLTTREIVPFALADNGQRWHVRAFDRRSGEFRDFVLARIADAKSDRRRWRA
jgi:hypothetical protein